MKYESDCYDELLLQVQLYRIDKAINLYLSDDWKENPMTPQEELFAKLFSHEAVLVSEMDTLTLRAHREELAITAFTARAKLSAVDAEEKRRKNEANKGKPTGFARSVNTDDTTTAAINNVKDRQKRMTNREKIIEGLVKLGYTREDAEQKMSAGEIIRQQRAREEQERVKKEQANAPKVINPFAKKE